MASGVVHVVARFAVEPDCIEAFVREAERALVQQARRQPGCPRYELSRDTAEPTRFAMLESWNSEAALAAHLAQESLQQAVALLLPMALELPEVRRYRPV
jgi:quinol monooxygenase YgiN